MDEQRTHPAPSRKKLPVWGIVLVVIGGAWLLQNLGFSWANGIWLPIVLIVIGVSLLSKRA